MVALRAGGKPEGEEGQIPHREWPGELASFQKVRSLVEASDLDEGLGCPGLPAAGVGDYLAASEGCGRRVRWDLGAIRIGMLGSHH